MIRRLRVLLREMPPLLRDIVEDAVVHQDDMELLADRRAAWTGPAEVAEGPDVIVTATGDVDRSEAVAADWLRRRPHSRVVVIETTGLRTVMWEMCPSAVRLGDLSPEQLIEVIRSGRTGGPPGAAPRG